MEKQERARDSGISPLSESLYLFQLWLSDLAVRMRFIVMNREEGTLSLQSSDGLLYLLG